jgi:serine/threonine protein kinase
LKEGRKMSEEKKWEIQEGVVVGDRYKIGKEIGRGGMGVVYRGLDQRLGREVAVKFLLPEYVTDVEAILRFGREALAAGKLGHENICDVRDKGSTDERVPYIVMELLQGEPLSAVLERERRIEVERAVDILSQVLSALIAVHAKEIVHRDLKPENIFLVVGADGRERVKILDFGISKHLDRSGEMRLTKTGFALGSPFYMSPEQARGRRDIDYRTDLWSIGAVFFEMLTGERPFDGENYNEVLGNILTNKAPDPKDIAPDIPDELAEVLRRALAWDLDKRFVTAAEFATTLLGDTSRKAENVVEGDDEESGSKEEDTTVIEDEIELLFKRDPRQSFFIFAVAVSIVAGAIFGWWFFFPPDLIPPSIADGVAEDDGDQTGGDAAIDADVGAAEAPSVTVIADGGAEEKAPAKIRPRRREKKSSPAPADGGGIKLLLFPPPPAKGGIRLLPPPQQRDGGG